MKLISNFLERQFLLPIVTLGLGVVIFLPSVTNYFVSDDFALIEQSHVDSWRGLGEFFTTPGQGDRFRPIVHILFAINHAIFGLRPFGYHIINILLHGMNALIIYWLAKRLTDGNTIPFVAAVIFATHFIHAEAVLWISGITDLLATFFYLASLFFFLTYLQRWPSGRILFSLSLLFTILAFLTKETTVTIPILILVLSIESEGIQSDRPLRSILWCCVPFGLLLLAACIFRIGLHGRIPGFWADQGVFSANILIIMKNLAYYLVNLIVPVRVVFDLIDYKTYTTLTDMFQKQEVILLLPSIILVGCSFYGITFLLRRLSHIGKTGLIWLLVTLIPLLLFRDVGQRLTYLPSVGFCLILADLFRKSKKENRFGLQRLFIPIILISCFAIQERNIWWKRAGTQAEFLLKQMQRFCEQIQTAGQIYVVGIPQRLHGAYIFSSGLDSAIKLSCKQERLQIRQKAQLNELVDVHWKEDDLVILYRNGEFSSWHPFEDKTLNK